MQTQLRDVEYFAAIAEHGQVQRAAAALGLSQPALSKSLRRLELAMNAKLLIRTPKGVDLTSVGAALLARVKQLRLSLDDVTREIADLSEGRAGHLRIGMGVQLAHVVPTVCTAMLKEAPRLTIELRSGDHASLVAELHKGTLDLAVSSAIAPCSEGMIEARLYEEESATIYAAANHRLAKRRQVSLADLAQERWTLPSPSSGTPQFIAQAFSNNGLPPPKIAVETSIMMARFRLAATSYLLTYGTKAVAETLGRDLGIVALRVKVSFGTRRVCVTYRKDAYLPPAAFQFIEILRKVVGDVTRKER